MTTVSEHWSWGSPSKAELHSCFQSTAFCSIFHKSENISQSVCRGSSCVQNHFSDSNLELHIWVLVLCFYDLSTASYEKFYIQFTMTSLACRKCCVSGKIFIDLSKENVWGINQWAIFGKNQPHKEWTKLSVFQGKARGTNQSLNNTLGITFTLAGCKLETAFHTQSFVLNLSSVQKLYFDERSHLWSLRHIRF